MLLKERAQKVFDYGRSPALQGIKGMTISGLPIVR
jgi:hypothetical protein